MAAIDVVDAVVRIDGRTILDSVQLQIADGEALAILGPSGCGKTTLLRVIAGLQPVDSGSIAFDGIDSTNATPADRGIGMVFQGFALYPHMRAAGILGFYYRLRGRDAEVGDRVRDVCEIMGPDFADLLSRKPGTLSGGQKQRVAIGRCIIRHPRAFLFDEPLSSLDARLRARTRVEIKRLLRRFGVTAAYVSHDQTEASAIGDRIAVMRAGQIEQIGPWRDLYERPRTTFVASFLGSPPMNLLAVIAEDQGLRVVGATPETDGDAPDPLGGVLVPSGCAEAFLPILCRPTVPTGTMMHIGCRPEAVKVGPIGAGGVSATVVAVEPVVADRQVLVTCVAVVPATTGLRPAITIRARAPTVGSPEIGDRVVLSIDPGVSHLFDANGDRHGALLYSARYDNHGS